MNWRLLTDLPVTSVEEALEKTCWYALRWKIEIFHKILKSGCKAEESLLRSSERLAKLISVFCIVSWRIFWMTMLNRAAPGAPPDPALTEDECRTLDQLTNSDPPPSSAPRGMSHYLTAIARLGGYLARRRDPPPGNTVMWRGLRRLADIMLGVQIQKTYGQLEARVKGLQNNMECTEYALALGAKLPIGSGVTEAACKHIIKERVCGSGMKWNAPPFKACFPCAPCTKAPTAGSSSGHASSASATEASPAAVSPLSY